MLFSPTDAQALGQELNTFYTEASNFFTFPLNKSGYTICIDLLKDGQYILVSLTVGLAAYSIEHIEFYMGETKDEVVQELREVFELLSRHETRLVSVVGPETKVGLEILQNGKWTQYGYFSAAKMV
ncbi:hypothetical protein [Hymenobacter metallicola]|uniref:Uncharacterized protein n=1 Tax=Hymenobacter metallicola TaxID=2563114 RepID=A0A4Z0QG01_9BACT|nr:hypothetical protein [Hymenobacter metallicola]TGE28947.1 hypothetical protein E5K02_05655 [Hymenobacter metallicola]